MRMVVLGRVKEKVRERDRRESGREGFARRAILLSG